ncbi:hypothetical protein AAGS61_01590 [Lysinibacillus sp. KU-BSD001]|uniref:hypothetical protein n=1 Tax=Lysinibacillus sp. KU-BSD001 TaxID=3141328 RepID=UPI0036F0070B
MNLTIEELKEALLNAELVELFQKAYNQGVEDARKLVLYEHQYPPRMEKEHVADFFQIALPTVEKIIRMDGFPICGAVRARYPRDKVFEWADRNTKYMNERLGIYVSESDRLKFRKAQ